MESKHRIATYYANAREFVKQNRPREARAYVLAILNNALESYKRATSILLQAKTAAFMDRWIAVSRDLYEKGVTDYVLQCFGLPTSAERDLPKVRRGLAKPRAAEPDAPQPVDPEQEGGVIDISGLIAESAKMQGWCAEIFEKSRAAVVEITVSGPDGSASGTGFVISKNGYILTNDHVVYCETAEGYYPKAKISFSGDKKSYDLQILFSDKKADVALCKFDPEKVGSFSVIKRVREYSQVLQGADCLIIGNAFGMGLAPFTGVVRFTKNDNGDLVYTAPSNPGDSGGPVLNRNGECIGINKSKTLTVNNQSADGYANATPMDTIDALLKKWCESNQIQL